MLSEIWLYKVRLWLKRCLFGYFETQSSAQPPAHILQTHKNNISNSKEHDYIFLS